MFETITLDGRKWANLAQARFPASQDDYILGHLRLAGALEILNDADGIERTEEKRAEELLTQLLLSGRAHYVLAGCLTEEGKTWSRREADANAGRFAGIIDASDKTEMLKLIVAFVVALFTVRMASSENSTKPSSQSGDFPATVN